jgi:hypothetical protein
MNYETFKKKYLIENLTDKKGIPKHTRLIKRLFYKFRSQLKEEFGFDILTCSVCGIQEWNNRPIIMELDHLNRVTNDSRIENLDSKCPNCHQQTLGYANRSSEIEEYFQKITQ